MTFQRMFAKSLITRLEVRHDSSDAAVFPRGNVGDPNVKSQTTVALGRIYAFTTAPQ